MDVVEDAGLPANAQILDQIRIFKLIQAGRMLTSTNWSVKVICLRLQRYAIVDLNIPFRIVPPSR